MKKIYAVLFSVFAFTFNTNAQITIYSTDVVGVGDVIITGYDSSTAFVSPGNASSSAQTWNFQNFQSINNDTMQFINPSTISGGNPIPSSNLAHTDPQGIGYNLYSKSSTGLSYLGNSYFNGSSTVTNVYSSPYKILTFPATYNTAFSGSFVMVDRYFDGTDSLKYETTINYNAVVDAFGTISTPVFSNVAALRLKRSETATGVEYVKSGGTGSWTPNGNTFADTVYAYAWWSKQHKIELFSISYNTQGMVGSISFLKTAPINTGIKTQEKAGLSIYPNPSAGLINIHNMPEGEKRILVYDAIGKLVQETVTEEINEGLKINNKGFYLLQIISTEGISTEKIVIE